MPAGGSSQVIRGNRLRQGRCPRSIAESMPRKPGIIHLNPQESVDSATDSATGPSPGENHVKGGGQAVDGLGNYSSLELQEELRRRKAASKPGPPAFVCERCGRVGYYLGHFKPHWYEIQLKSFEDKHRDCKPFFGGGGI